MRRWGGNSSPWPWRWHGKSCAPNSKPIRPKSSASFCKPFPRSPPRRRGAGRMSEASPAGLRPKRWLEALVQARERMASAPEFVVEGTLNRMVGMTLEAVGCEAAVGGRCLVDTAEGKQIEAEVVGFSGDKLFLMPTGDIRGVMPGARVIPTHSVSSMAMGDELLGRVLDGAGRPLDGFGELKCTDLVSLAGVPVNTPIRRANRQPPDVGGRSVNALLAVGGGQRSGLFAGAGV